MFMDEKADRALSVVSRDLFPSSSCALNPPCDNDGLYKTIETIRYDGTVALYVTSRRLWDTPDAQSTALIHPLKARTHCTPERNNSSARTGSFNPPQIRIFIYEKEDLHSSPISKRFLVDDHPV